MTPLLLGSDITTLNSSGDNIFICCRYNLKPLSFTALDNKIFLAFKSFTLQTGDGSDATKHISSNGNTITTNNPNDPRKWLIDNNQKRPFPDLQSFYAFEGDWKKVKTLSDDVIDSIPEGEPV